MAEIIYSIGSNEINDNDCLRSRVNAYFKYLLENSILSLDDTVVVFLERKAELIYVIEACFRLGITYIPVDTTFPDERISFILKDSDSRFIITDRKFKEKFVDYKIFALDEFIIEDRTLERYELTESRYILEAKLAYIIYTSGTTGVPKGVKVSRRAVWNFIEGESAIIEFGEHRNMLCAASVSFDIFFAESVLPLLKGTNVVLLNEKEQNNIALFSKAIIKHNINIIQLTPSRLRILYAYDNELKCLRNMKSILIGGEDLSKELLDIVKSKTTSAIYNMYGPTETAICITIGDLTESSTIHIGKPIKNINVILCDDELNPVPYGEKGEICIEGLSVGEGYINRKDLTDAKFVQSSNDSIGVMYRTGDIARYLPDGNLKFLGRKDHQVKLNGYRIELEEIERVAVSISKINEAVAKVNKTSNTIEVYYTASVSGREILLKEIFVKKLPKYMIPAKYIQVDQFEYTKNGKINRMKI